MAFACPGCSTPIERSPELPILRCPQCGAVLRSRSVEGDGASRAYEVEVAGRPQTRRRVELPWSEAESRRLGRWLAWASALTLGLVLLLYLAARLAR